MDKDQLSKLVEDRYTIKDLSQHFAVGKSTIRYWLNKYDLKTYRGPKGKLPKDYEKPRLCRCGESNPDKFYGNKSNICSKCHNEYQTAKGRQQKFKAVEHLGGKCVRCGYCKCTAALDIHHLDSATKDPNFNTHRYWSWERLLIELKGCILLCRNCHAEEHYN